MTAADLPSTAHSGAGPALTGWRLTTDRIWSYAMELFVLAVLAQVYLAGVGVFGDHRASGVTDATSFDPHRGLGTLLGFVAVVLFLVAIAVRQSRATVVAALVLAVATLVAQPILAAAGDNNKWAGGFHALDGMLILGLSLALAHQGRRRNR